MRHTICVLLLLAITRVLPAGEIFKLPAGREPERNNYSGSGEEKLYKQWIRTRQQKWIGVQAPELGPDAEDRTTTPTRLIKLSDFRGRRVLLYGFFAGNFNWSPNENQLMGALHTLDKERKTSAGRELAVIGFTSGMELFPYIWGRTEADIHPKLRKVTGFPLVLNINRNYPEPYDPVLSLSAYGAWGAILIDRNGVILRFYNDPLTAKQLKEAIQLPDWNGQPRSAPTKP